MKKGIPKSKAWGMKNHNTVEGDTNFRLLSVWEVREEEVSIKVHWDDS